ncbi:MAG: DNA polymerase III subunit beta [bacterium]
MKLEIEKEKLLRLFSVANKATAPKSNLPALGNVLLKAEGDNISVSGTNLDQEVVATEAAEVKEEGCVLIPGPRMKNLVGSMTGPVKIKKVRNDIEVSSEGFSAKLKGLPVDEYCGPALTGEPEVFNFSGERFSEALNSVVFAASADATRHMLNGVYFEADENGCRVVATDGRRLSVCSIEDGEHPKAGVILPTLAADIISEAAGSQEEIEFRVASSYVRLATKTTQVFSKTIAAEFPDYRKVMPSPEDTDHIASFDKGELSSAFRRTALFSNPKSPVTRLECVSGSLTITSKAPEEGEANEVVEGEGQSFSTALQPHYMQQFLKTTKGESVTICVGDSADPIRVLAEDTEYVVMPVRK